MLSTFLRRRGARVVRRYAASARSNTLTLVAVNDVYDLEHLPKLRTLVDAVKAERVGGRVITTLAGDFLSPSVLSHSCSLSHFLTLLRSYSLPLLRSYWILGPRVLSYCLTES